MNKIDEGRLGFWGVVLAGAADVHLELQRMQQLAAAAPGGAFPGVTQLTIKLTLAVQDSSITTQSLHQPAGPGAGPF
jgi:hypothetical protein